MLIVQRVIIMQNECLVTPLARAHLVHVNLGCERFSCIDNILLSLVRKVLPRYCRKLLTRRSIIEGLQGLDSIVGFAQSSCHHIA